MFKGLGDMAKLMKQAKEMQEKMAEAQARIAEIVAEGSSGAGLVKCSATAEGEVKSLAIDASLVVAEEKEVLEDLVVAAVNDATRRAREMGAQEMAKVTEGMPLPPGMKMPF